MKNIRIYNPRKNYFTVVADTDEFGANEVVFEGISLEECIAYIKANTKAQKKPLWAVGVETERTHRRHYVVVRSRDASTAWNQVYRHGYNNGYLCVDRINISAGSPAIAPAETETATDEATPATEAAPTDAAELDSLKAIRDDITTDPNPDTIRAAQDAINRHFVEIDPEDIDTPRKIRAALTDIINAIYWDIAEDITPATTATETAAPLQLETLAARLDRMTAAELVELYAATSAPGSIDDETDSAIYIALHAINPRAYRVWMQTSVEYIPGDPDSIEAANAADVERLRAAYGVTA